MIAGIPVIVSPFAEQTVVEYKVEAWPIRKRRRGWHVVRHERVEPCMFMFGSQVAALHPRLLEQMARNGQLVKVTL